MNIIYKNYQDLIENKFNILSPLFVHEFNLNNINKNNKEQDTGVYFRYQEQNKKFPNIICDLSDVERKTNIMREYLFNIIYPNVKYGYNHYIHLNRIYRFTTNGRTFIIQILFKSITDGDYEDDPVNEYYIFIFECFKNIDQLLSTIDPSFRHKILGSIDFLKQLNEEIYVFITYRDIVCEHDINMRSGYNKYKLFMNESGLSRKYLKYYGNYLITSDAYRRQNFLSILYLIYGIIMKEVECIYDVNDKGVEYAKFIILQLYNATRFSHKKCPYCQLGYRIAKKGAYVDNQQYLTKYNEETQQKIIQNKDIYRLTDEYYIKNISVNNVDSVKNIHSIESHYFNPSQRQLDIEILQKIEKSGTDKLGNQLVLDNNQELVKRIRDDLSSLNNKRFIIMDYDELLNYLDYPIDYNK